MHALYNGQNGVRWGCWQIPLVNRWGGKFSGWLALLLFLFSDTHSFPHSTVCHPLQPSSSLLPIVKIIHTSITRSRMPIYTSTRFSQKRKKKRGFFPCDHKIQWRFLSGICVGRTLDFPNENPIQMIKRNMCLQMPQLTRILLNGDAS